MSNDFSIWLLPSAVHAARLDESIALLSSHLGSPKFAPHVTIQGDITTDLGPLSRLLERLAACQAPLRWHVEGVETSENFFRSLYLRLTLTPAFGLMQQAMDGHKAEMSAYAPRLYTMKINPEKIRDVIGKGGAVIRAITEETGTTIDIQEDGTITIASVSSEGADAAKKKISEITAEVEIGKIYEGPVVKILDNNVGAIVSIMPGKDGLVHISQIANERVKSVTDYLKEGQVVCVKALEQDERGRVRLSIKAVLNDEAAANGEVPSAPAAE